jgi:hypothetical protein
MRNLNKSSKIPHSNLEKQGSLQRFFDMKLKVEYAVRAAQLLNIQSIKSSKQ